MHKFEIDERRRKVASLLALSITETEIAQESDVDQSTVSRDIKVLKHLLGQKWYRSRTRTKGLQPTCRVDYLSIFDLL